MKKESNKYENVYVTVFIVNMKDIQSKPLIRVKYL